MTLEFDRECLIVNGFPILGTVSVSVSVTDASFYHEHGCQHERDIETTVDGFEPEDGRTGLLWAEVEAPLKEWLEANKARIVEATFKRS